MKQIFLAVAIVISAIFAVNAQTDAQKKAFEDFRKDREVFMNKMKNDFESFKKHQDSLNYEFAKHVKEAWEEFEACKGVECPRKPVPQVQPQYNAAPSTNTYKEIVVQKVVEEAIAEQKEERQGQDFLIEQTADEEIAQNYDLQFEEYHQEKVLGQSVTVDFFGYYLDMLYENEFIISMPDNRESSVAAAWEQLSRTNYSKLVSQLQQLEAELHLNDWAVYQLISNTSKMIFPKDKINEKRVFDVFLYSQLGYAAKMGRMDGKIIVLIPFKTEVYKLPYYTFKNTKYYLMDCNGNKPQKFYSYSFDLGTNRATCDLDIKHPMWLPQKSIKKKYGKGVLPNEIDVVCNQNSLDFYGTMPMTDLSTYASSEIDALVSNRLLNSLRPFVEGKSEKEAASILLAFVQKSFKYSTDEEQFGYEKYFFPDELLFYNNSDCEDRSILFSYLVRKLLNLNVVLVDYPDHVATAVHFNENVSGDYVKYKGKNYVICDPTYVGAPVGEAMPEYKNVPAVLIAKH